VPVASQPLLERSPDRPPAYDDRNCLATPVAAICIFPATSAPEKTVVVM